MKKLKLDLDELKVESFEISSSSSSLRGTVNGNLPPSQTCANVNTCNGVNTCPNGPIGTCAQTQCGTCAGPTCSCYTSIHQCSYPPSDNCLTDICTLGCV